MGLILATGFDICEPALELEHPPPEVIGAGQGGFELDEQGAYGEPTLWWLLAGEPTRSWSFFNSVTNLSKSLKSFNWSSSPAQSWGRLSTKSFRSDASPSSTWSHTKNSNMSIFSLSQN
jgi:hypothetical protein